MTKTIQIAPDLKLPLDTVVQRKTIVAKNRVGKSNTACAYVEEVHKIGVQTIVIDPKGDWYGIRSSADGKGAGLPFLVMGGDFGDVPLDPSAGTALGEYLGTNHVDVVLDVSDFSRRDVARFGADFFEALYIARKKNRTPLDLVIEEAEDFAPQQIFDKTSSIEQSRCLGALIKIAKKAGFLGIGLLLIAQRTASLNKNVLSQSDGLIIMRTTAPQDLKAVDAWLENQSDEQRDYVKKHIQGLPTGTAIVWFPELGLFKQAQVRRRETFDAGYTPKIGETKPEPKVRAKVDLERLMGSLKQVVDEAKANDPAVLKARIQDLEGKLYKALQQNEPEVVEKVVEKHFVKRFMPDSLRTAIEETVLRLNEAVEAAEEEMADDHPLEEPRVVSKQYTVNMGELKKTPMAPHVKQIADSYVVKMNAAEAGLSGPQQRILDAVRWFEAIGNKEPAKEAVAFIAGYRPGGGAFANPLGQLRNQDGKHPWPPLIEYGNGTVRLTPEGRKLANKPQAPGTTTELHRMVLERLSGPEERILEPLLRCYPKSMDKDTLAEKSGYSVGGGAFANPLGRLRSLGLIDYPERGQVVAMPLLFP